MTNFSIQFFYARIGMPFLFLILSKCFVYGSANTMSPRVAAAEKNPLLEPIYLEDVIFELFTRDTSKNGKNITVGDRNSLKGSNFNANNPTKIITHGWLAVAREPQFVEMKDAFLKAGPFNVFLVDWSKCSKNMNYSKSANCTMQVGNHIGTLIKFLAEEANLSMKDVHVIGHSLGAQVMAFVSEVLPQKVPRITGLDPAGPHFENAKLSERLDPGDADFVDTIHTCSVFLSSKNPDGTATFFVNGGYYQPGCGWSLSLKDLKKLITDLGCNHEISHEYFTKTISEQNRDIYIGKKCKTLEEAYKGPCNGEDGIMGYDATESSPGVYFVKITEKP